MSSLKMPATAGTTSLTVRFATANVLTLYPNRAVQGGFVSARQQALRALFHQQGTRSKLQGHHLTDHFSYGWLAQFRLRLVLLL